MPPTRLSLAGHGAPDEAENAFAPGPSGTALAGSRADHTGRTSSSPTGDCSTIPSSAAKIERAVVFTGHPALSRQVPAMLSRPQVVVHVVRGITTDAHSPGHHSATIGASGRVHDSRTRTSRRMDEA
jgi:2-succinyl-5-enolpyruvyl-6-hydroxy-3-cyclohexene-1-carboxylate synthase